MENGLGAFHIDAPTNLLKHAFHGDAIEWA